MNRQEDGDNFKIVDGYGSRYPIFQEQSQYYASHISPHPPYQAGLQLGPVQSHVSGGQTVNQNFGGAHFYMPQSNYYFNQLPGPLDQSRSQPSDQLTQHSKALTGFNAQRNLNIRTHSDNMELEKRRQYSLMFGQASYLSDDLAQQKLAESRIRREVDMIVQEDEGKSNLSGSQISLLNNPENYYELNYQYVKGQGWDVPRPIAAP